MSPFKPFETHFNEVCRTDVRQPYPYRDYHQPPPLPIWNHCVSHKPRYSATPNCCPMNLLGEKCKYKLVKVDMKGVLRILGAGWL